MQEKFALFENVLKKYVLQMQKTNKASKIKKPRTLAINRHQVTKLPKSVLYGQIL